MEQLSKNPLFSVLIANYNNGQFIAQAIKSVLAQSYEHWEIIIVDDASKDDSINIIQPFLDNKRIKLYLNDLNSGCGFTKKRCADLASGEICGFLDPDDALAPNALETMVKEHELHPRCVLINSTYYICDESLTPQSIGEKPGAIPEGETCLFIKNAGKVSQFATFKQYCYCKTSKIDPGLPKAVDKDLYFKLEDTGPTGFVNAPLYYYRHHKGSISLGKNERDAFFTFMIVLDGAIQRRLATLKGQQHNTRIRLQLWTELMRVKFILSKKEKQYMAEFYWGILYLYYFTRKKILTI